MATLATVVFLRDPERHRVVVLHPGEEPAPHLAALITNPACWEGGKLPALDSPPAGPAPDAPEKKSDPTTAPSPEPEPAKPTRKTAARKPAADQ